MKKFKRIIASSQTTSDGQLYTRELLKTMIEQLNTEYLPIGIKHDPRKPPVGRFVSAKLIPLKDGEYAVEGYGEIFEPDDLFGLQDDSRTIPIRLIDSEGLQVFYDKNYKNSEDQQDLKNMGSIIGDDPHEEVKLSLDPISTLTIYAGIFVLGGIAGGFLNKLGSDAWDKLKEILIRVMSRRKEGEKDKLLIFQFTVKHEDHLINVETILSNPKEDDINNFFSDALPKLEIILPSYCKSDSGVKWIALEYSQRDVKVLFGIRKDAVPMFPIPNDERHSGK